MNVARLGVALVVGAVLVSCYGSSGGQAKDGQSHWLERCSRLADCGDGQVCACGVCTIGCTEPATCGSEGLCASVEDSQCGEAHEAPERVCLNSCSEDDDCNASGIECRTGACVNVSAVVEEDASGSEEPALEDAGGSVAPDDAGAPSDVTTVIDLELAELGETVGVLDFVLADGAVIWETAVAGAEGGYIYRRDLESGDTRLLDSPPIVDADAQLEVQGDILFYAVGPRIYTLYVSDGEESWRAGTEDSERMPWATDSEHIYIVSLTYPDRLFRMDHLGSPEEDVYISEDGAPILALALDADAIYVEEKLAASSESRVRRVAKDGFSADTFVEPFRNPLGFLTVSMAFFVHEGFLISDRGMHGGIQALSLASGALTALTDESVALATASSASNGYVYFAESTGPRGSNEDLFVSRVSIPGLENERLRSTTGFANQVAEANGYLYWTEQGRLLRKAL